MNDNQNALLQNVESTSFDFDELECQLESDLEEQVIDLELLKEDRDKISNPESLGSTVMNVVWDQFINQVGVVAGEDFIKENRGLTLDLSNDAHIQTTENFAQGKIATHNDKINYQKRYDDWQANFRHDENGKVMTHFTRTGKQEATLVKGARDPFDYNRPSGSVERGTDMDHTISAGEIIRDPAANAHLTREEQIEFANSKANLNEMDASQNRSKGDKSMTDWLDNPNKNGQKPKEIFDLSEEQERQYRENDAKARAEFAKRKQEGERRSIETGKQSQKEEAFRIGGKALRAVIMALIAELMKKIVQKLIAWLRSANKSLETFISQVKAAIHDFIHNLKQNFVTAGESLVTTIATAIIGPVVSMIKKAWIFLKQGYKSIKEAIRYVKSHKDKPFSIVMLEVGKIVIAGFTAGGAIVLGEVIEKALMSIPIFAFHIPIIGSLANILGIFFGALVAGIIGALALSLIDKAIAKKQIKINEDRQFEKRNEIIIKQNELINVAAKNLQNHKTSVIDNIAQRHKEAADIIKDSINFIMRDSQDVEDNSIDIDEKLDGLMDDINNL